MYLPFLFLRQVTGISMESMLVGEDLNGSGFVYGSLSFVDKLSCGLALYALESYQGKTISKLHLWSCYFNWSIWPINFFFSLVVSLMFLGSWFFFSWPDRCPPLLTIIITCFYKIISFKFIFTVLIQLASFTKGKKFLSSLSIRSKLTTLFSAESSDLVGKLGSNISYSVTRYGLGVIPATCALISAVITYTMKLPDARSITMVEPLLA